MTEPAFLSGRRQHLVTKVIRWALALFALTYACSGVRNIAPGEIGLVYRLGKLVGEPTTTAMQPPGLLLTLPFPFDDVVRVSVKREVSLDIDQFWQKEDAADPRSERSHGADAQTVARDDVGECRYVLTGDRNLLGIRMTAKYLITAPVAHARCSADPDALCQRVVIGELQKAVNRASVDEVLQLRSERRHRKPATGVQVKNGGEASDSVSVNITDLVKEGSQSELDQLRCGVTLTSVEIQAAHPPHEVHAAFEALQTARIEQETTRDRTLAFANESFIDAESLARQTIAEAKGNVERLQADVVGQIAMFQAAWEGARGAGVSVTQDRLRREAFQHVLDNCQRVYFVPEIAKGGQFRVFLPSRGRGP